MSVTENILAAAASFFVSFALAFGYMERLRRTGLPVRYMQVQLAGAATALVLAVYFMRDWLIRCL